MFSYLAPYMTQINIWKQFSTEHGAKYGRTKIDRPDQKPLIPWSSLDINT